jgi:hypothetical protein
MRTCPRLAYVLLTALLGTMGPGGRMPGPRMQGRIVRTVDCPDPNCGGRGRWQEGFLYKCRQGRHTFYYCQACEAYLSDAVAARHSCYLRG